ncbi:MAG: RHS repeat-associated core domain-containing protein, partial [Planctomycetota bacterium]
RSTTRTFTYDTAGRRLASTDPDTDSTAPGATAANETWRYLFNRVGDLVAVRDPRGCGQNFYYDHGGRLLGEDYVQCGESQDPGDLPTDDIPGSAIADGELGAARFVDVRHYFDADPGWASDVTGSLHADAEARPTSPYLVGRMTASADRGQRTLYAYDARGRGVWQARQMALIPTDSYSASTLSGDRPSLVTSESVTTGTREYDEAPDHTYVLTNTYDFGDRATGIGLPLDPDFGLLSGTPTAPPPPVTATMNYNWLSLPNNAIAYIDGTPQTIIWQQVYARDRIPFLTYFGDDKGPGGVSRTRSRIWTTLDPLRRLPTKSEFWRDNGGVAVTTDLQTYQRPFREYYGWDDADNLVSVTNNSTDTYPAGYRRQRRLVEHDALYRVQHVDFAYHDNHLAWTPTDTALDPRATRQTHLASDPMRERPAPMLPSLPSNRVVNLTYEYDWLANMTEWTDDAASFYERSIGQIANGFEEGKRPSALYLSTNLSDTAPTTYSATLDRGGWLEVGYGASGNVETLTVRAQCHDRDALNLCYDSGGNVDARATGINQGCQCDREQHYQYRWDELNRMSEARRYDRTGAGDWDLKVRQRYRYSAGNQRMVKQTHDADPDPGTPAERIHLYVYPGDFERSGVRLDAMNLEYDADATLGTETQYRIAGARIVWRATTDPNHALQKDIRVTYAMTDLIQSTSAVIDLYSGALLETRTYYPNGAIETHRAQDDVTMQLEPLGFTGKEADDEVGVVYFGERYLIPRIGRWASPDPLAIHAMSGGEGLNSYHYVSGNLLQARDPLGLCGDNKSCSPDHPEANMSSPDGGGQEGGGNYQEADGSTSFQSQPPNQSTQSGPTHASPPRQARPSQPAAARQTRWPNRAEYARAAGEAALQRVVDAIETPFRQTPLEEARSGDEALDIITNMPGAVLDGLGEIADDAQRTVTPPRNGEERLEQARATGRTLGNLVTVGAGEVARRLLRRPRVPGETLCFAGGTPISLPDGSFRAIEHIRIGDLVLSIDVETGELVQRAVAEIFATPQQDFLEVAVALADGSSEFLYPTADHPFWHADRIWIAAGELAPGAQERR